MGDAMLNREKSACSSILLVEWGYCLIDFLRFISKETIIYDVICLSQYTLVPIKAEKECVLILTTKYQHRNIIQFMGDVHLNKHKSV